MNARKKIRKNLRIAIIGEHEIIGLEECALDFQHRKMSVKCYSHSAGAYFIMKADILRFFRQFKMTKELTVELRGRKEIKDLRMKQIKNGFQHIEKITED